MSARSVEYMPPLSCPNGVHYLMVWPIHQHYNIYEVQIIEISMHTYMQYQCRVLGYLGRGGTAVVTDVF